MRTLLFLLIFLAFPAVADPKADLRALVYAGDIDGVEAMMEAAYRESLVSHGYEGLRKLNATFSVTDPKMKEFIAKWRTAKPQSPFAMTAEVWLLWRAGWLARGTELSRWTYPEAFALQYELNRQALDLAWKAFEKTPDLVSATDALIMLSQVTGGQDDVPEMLAAAMAATPNHGSLIRATNALAPNWGGSILPMAGMCALYADNIPDVADYTQKTCMIDAIFSADVRGFFRTWAQFALDATDNPILEQVRITDAIYWRRGTDEANKVLARYLDDPENIDWNAAGIHDLDYRVPHGLAPLAPEFFQRRLSHAIAEIVFDPYDYELLQIVFESVSYEGQPAKQVDKSLQLEAKRRALSVAPYNAEAWFQYGIQATFVFKYKEDEADPFYINAIAYSNHRPYYLSMYGRSVIGKLMWLLYEDMSTFTDIRDLPESVEQVDALVCPLVRVTRVMQEVCETTGVDEMYCMAHSWPVKHWQQVMSLAETENVCTAERTAPIEDLMYQPQVIDWSTVPRSASATTP